MEDDFINGITLQKINTEIIAEVIGSAIYS